MSLNDVTELTQETFATQAEGFPLILLAPRLRNRNALMAWFLRNASEAAFYALTAADADLENFLSGLITGLRDADAKFGKQTAQALADRQDAEELADALIADLGKLKPKLKYLLLDNFDLLNPSDGVSRFFDRLAKTLPSGTQLVINSRHLVYGAWSTLVRSHHAVVMGDERTLDGGIFAPEKPDTPHLEVYGLAGGNVYVNGVPLNTWDGPLPRNLFYYFVDHPMVTRDEIFETFWPELPTKEATNVFHVTKRKISERLGYELTAYAGGFYRPSGQMTVHYDVARFEQVVEESKIRPPDDPMVWYRAIQLYRSPFLNRIDMPWIVKRREELRMAYAEALIGVGRLYRALDEDEHAISYYLRALREVPQREDIHRDLMSLYSEHREIGKAVAQYSLLCEILDRTLGITPSKATQTLYKAISSGN